FGSQDSRRGQGYQGQQPFNEHAAIADEPGVLFIVQLFCGGTRGYQGVEARNGTTGHSNKEHGEEIAVGIKAGKGRQFKTGSADYNPQKTPEKQCVQEERVQVIPGLQENPDRGYRSNKDISQQEIGPGSGIS